MPETSGTIALAKRFDIMLAARGLCAGSYSSVPKAEGNWTET